MAEFLSYNEFLNESTVINDFDNSSFLLKTLDIAKKSKLLKYKAQEYSHDSQFSIRFGDFYGEINNRRTLDISMGTQKYSVCYLEEVRGEYGPSYNATDIRIAIFSEDPINLKMIEEVFPVIVKGTGGTQIRTLTRDIIDDYSTTAKTLSVSVRRVQDWNVSYSPNGHKILYYVSFNYHVTKEDKQSVTFEQIKNLPEYKDLITSLPVEMCSSPIRLKKLTLLFGLKLPYVFDTSLDLYANGKNSIADLSYSEKYVQYGYAIHDNGIIRNTPVYKSSVDRPGKTATFDNSTLEGWKDALKKVKSLFEKKIASFEKQGFLVSLDEPIDENNLPHEIQLKIIKLAKDGKVEWDVIKPLVDKELLKPYSAQIFAKKHNL